MGELELFAIMANKIWLRRNTVVFGGPVPSPTCLLKGARDLLGDGVGIIARNSMGLVKAAMCTVLPYIQNPTVAEAIGARRAVKFARKMGFSSIEIEGDSREVVLALRNSEECCVSYENIVTETRLLLGSFPG